MSCNTKTSLAAVIDAVNAQLNNNYIDRDDPRIDQGVFTEPTIRGGLMLDEAAKLDFCGYVTECGQREPFGKQWVDRPLYPHNTLVSYEDGGEIKSRWQDIDDVVAGTEIGESYATYEETRSLGLQGYTIIDSFELGATITQRNQALRHTADGKLYRWAGDLPKVVPVGSNPDSAGGIGSNAWLEVSDVALRQDIASGNLITDRLVKTLPVAADALTLNQAVKNKQILSILDYCKCDGTDESAQALKAVAYANSMRKELVIPSGVELLISGSTMLEPRYGITGPGRIRRRTTGWSGVPAVRLNSYSTYCNNVTFLCTDTPNLPLEDVVHLTTATAVCGWVEVTKNANIAKVHNNKCYGGARFGIWIYGGGKVSVVNNDISKIHETGIYFGTNTSYKRDGLSEKADTILIAGNSIFDITSVPFGGSTGVGIKLAAFVKNVAIVNNMISDTYADSIDCFGSGENVLIDGNMLKGANAKGIDIKNYGTNYPEMYGENIQITVTNNIISNAVQLGIAVSTNVSAEIQGVNISHNNIRNCGYGGILFKGTHAIITGNTIYECAKYAQSFASGILVEATEDFTTTNVVVSHNICLNNGSEGIPSNAGITVKGSHKDCSVVNNICCDVSKLNNAGFQNYGIYVTGSVNPIIVRGNRCSGNSRLPIGWYTGTNIIGETHEVNINKLTENADIILYGGSDNFSVVNFEMLSFQDVAETAETYWNYTLRHYSDGTDKLLVGSGVGDRVLQRMKTKRYSAIPNSALFGDVIYLKITKTTDALPLPNILAKVNIVTW